MKRLLSDYGMVLVLIALCIFFSAVTYTEQHPEGESGGGKLARQIERNHNAGASVLIAARGHEADTEFSATLKQELEDAGFLVVDVINGEPPDARRVLRSLADSNTRLDLIAGNQVTASWLVFSDLANG